jgi:sirohydrochlorin cobaltochelatase
MGVADEITAAFWKEMPSFHQVLRTLRADDITIVPLFTAQGYFTKEVIPTEMGLTGVITYCDGRTLRYARTLAEHPYLASVVETRVRDALATFSLNPSETAVAIIGHSTRRNPESRLATEAHAQRLRELQVVAQVQAVYLDDSPEIPDIYTLTDAPNLVAVPYFLAAGSHTTIDVPNALGLPDGVTQAIVQGRNVFYTAPVGVGDDLLTAILELAKEAGAPLYPINEGSVWRCFPTVGTEIVGELTQFGQLHIVGTLLAASSSFRLQDTASGVPTPIANPTDLRAHVRENPFRSLATSDDLPDGWAVNLDKPAKVAAAIETIYPGALAEAFLYQQGTLPITSLEALAARQTGMYRAVDQLDETQRQEIVQKVCGRCVRHPLWHNATLPEGKLPCEEACNHWLSAALEETT